MISSENFNSSSPVVSVPINPPITPNSQTTPSILNRRPIGLSILLLLLIGNFLYRTIASIVVIAVMTNSITQSHGFLPIFSIAPFICIFPVIGALTVVFLIYLFMKTRDLTAGSYKFLLNSLIIVPLLYTLLVYLLLSQTQTIYSASSLDTSSTSPNPLMPIFSAILNEINLLSLITLLVIRKKRDLFTNPPSNLNWRQKVILVVLGLIIFLPAFSETFTVIRSSLYSDTNFTQVRKEVGYNLYSPSKLPQGLEIATQYYIDDKNSLKLPNPIVKVAFDIPIKEILAGSKSKVIILNQSLVPSDFNLSSYLSSQFPNINPENVTISTATNKEGFLVINTAKYLYFVTSDNILISVSAISPQISEQDLVNFAESLK